MTLGAAVTHPRNTPTSNTATRFTICQAFFFFSDFCLLLSSLIFPSSPIFEGLDGLELGPKVEVTIIDGTTVEVSEGAMDCKVMAVKQGPSVGFVSPFKNRLHLKSTFSM